MELNKSTRLLASICMLTYNHESFIGQAIEGVLMQQTDFAFEIIIGEDCGSDNTREIVKKYADKYPDIIVPIFYSVNQGSTNNLINLVNKSRSDIIAICDGDDYWTDPVKLQKEVEFLINNPEFGMLCSKSNKFIQSKNKFEGVLGDSVAERYEEIYYGFDDVSAPSIVFRKSDLLNCIKGCEQLIEKNLFFDTPMVLWFSYHEKVKFFDEIRSVYRVLNNSASHLKDEGKRLKFNQDYLFIKLFFAIYYPVKDYDKRKVILDALNEQIDVLINYASYKGSKDTSQSKAYKIGRIILKPFKAIREKM